jgi:hypothetical protein
VPAASSMLVPAGPVPVAKLSMLSRPVVRSTDAPQASIPADDVLARDCARSAAPQDKRLNSIKTMTKLLKCSGMRRNS